MNGFTYENQGTNTYLVYALKETDSLDTMSLGMITNNKIPGLANTVFMQLDNQKYIKYNVSAKVSVKQFFTGAVNKKRLLGVFRGIVDAMLSAEEYMIDHEMIVLDLEHIFADVSTCETVLICVPVLGDSMEPLDLGMFFKSIMFSTQFDQTENCDYVAKIINYLNSTPLFSLIDFQALLDSVDTAVNQPAGYVKTQSVVTPQPAASPQPVVALQPAANQQPAASPQPVVKTQPAMSTPIEVPGSPIQADSVKKTQTKEGEKPMSMFYLLQHYNKENAAAYKAQKEAQKTEKKASESKKDKKTKKNKEVMDVPSMKVPGAPGIPVPGYAIPGQSVQPQPIEPMKPETVTKPVTPTPVTPAPVTPPPVATVPQTPNYPTYPAATASVGYGETTVLNNVVYGETTVLSGDLSNVAKAPYLVRSKNNEKILINKPVFRIGKERSYVDYFIGDNAAISRSHANIITREGQYFVVDTNSTNHTYVNGRMIQSNEEVQITSGNNIKLGNEDFEFKIV